MNGFIELVTGTLGGGKTALAVERIYDHLCRGAWVFTNVECYPGPDPEQPESLKDNIRDRMAGDGFVFEPDRLVMLKGDAREYHKVVKRGTREQLVMLVIDEAGLEINARDWAKTEKEQLAFNTMARKLDIWLVYISQSAEDVDKQIRKKADTIWVCRNMKKLKIWGFIPCPLPFYFRVRFDNTRGAGKPQKMDSEVQLRSPAWGLYNSDAMVGQVSSVFREMETARGGALKRIKSAKLDSNQTWGLGALTAFISCVVFLLFS